MKVSACVMCYNEENKIGRALESLHWADEIVVVDSKSTDNTPEICKKYATKFIQNDWPGFSKQREFLLEQTSFDWVFFLDADEFCTPELIKKVKEIKSQDTPSHNLYKIHRKEHMFGKWYKYGCGNPSYQDRFFNKQGVKFVGKVHEYPVCEGEPGWVHEYLHHDSFETIEDMLTKLNHYTTADAEDMFQRGVKHSWPYMFFSGLIMFLKGYFKKRGILDGPHGLIMASFDGMTFFLRQAKLWRLWHIKGKA